MARPLLDRLLSSLARVRGWLEDVTESTTEGTEGQPRTLVFGEGVDSGDLAMAGYALRDAERVLGGAVLLMPFDSAGEWVVLRGKDPARHVKRPIDMLAALADCGVSDANPAIAALQSWAAVVATVRAEDHRPGAHLMADDDVLEIVIRALKEKARTSRRDAQVAIGAADRERREAERKAWNADIERYRERPEDDGG